MFFSLYFHFLCMGVLPHACLCMQGAQSQKRTLNCVELVVSHRMGTNTGIRVFCKISHCSCLAFPYWFFFNEFSHSNKFSMALKEFPHFFFYLCPVLPLLEMRRWQSLTPDGIMPFCFIVWSGSVVDKRLSGCRKAVERMRFYTACCISVDAGTIGSSDH